MRLSPAKSLEIPSAVGCERTFSEQVSSVGKREQLEAAIFARDGDTFVITRLDRLARSTQDLLGIVERLDKKGVALRILDFAGEGKYRGRAPTARSKTDQNSGVGEGGPHKG